METEPAPIADSRDASRRRGGPCGPWFSGRAKNSCSCSGVIGLLIGPSDTELDATHVLGATRQGTRGMILRQLLESIPDMVDRYMPAELRSHTNIRYFLYWLVLAASIVLSACILRSVVAFGVVLLYASDHQGFARQRKALKAAQVYCPNSATPRSSLARDNDMAVQGKRQAKRRLARAKRLQDFRSETELRWVATAGIWATAIAEFDSHFHGILWR